MKVTVINQEPVSFDNHPDFPFLATSSSSAIVYLVYDKDAHPNRTGWKTIVQVIPEHIDTNMIIGLPVRLFEPDIQLWNGTLTMSNN